MRNDGLHPGLESLQLDVVGLKWHLRHQFRWLNRSLPWTANPQNSNFVVDDCEQHAIHATSSGLEQQLLYIEFEVLTFVRSTATIGESLESHASLAVCIQPSGSSVA
jgi:hypothetical protein